MRLVSATLDTRLLENYFVASPLPPFTRSTRVKTLPKEEDWLNAGDWRVKIPVNAHNLNHQHFQPFRCRPAEPGTSATSRRETFEVSYFYLANIWAC